MSGPLEGVRVVDLTRLLPGAFATALLGDLGADVVKVEQPGIGDPMRAYPPATAHTSAYTWTTDRNKRSIALDLRDPRGVEVVLRLVAEADVVVEGFRPGVCDRLGLGYDALSAVNPRIVMCSLSGYGATGPLAAEAGHDLNYLARAGVASGIGADGRPAIPNIQVADLSGSLLGVAGLLAALVGAQRTGVGDHVDLALTDAAFTLHSVHLGAHLADGRVPGFGTELLSGAVPCYQLYECADHRWLAVGALEPKFFNNLCAAVDRPDLRDTREDPGALDEWRALFATRTRDEWMERLGGADACAAPVNDLAEAVADPQLRARELVTEVDGLPIAASPIKLRERPASIRSAAPALGADTRAVLRAAGYDDDAVDALLADGVAVEG